VSAPLSVGVASCRICGSPTRAAGERRSDFSQRTFALSHCPTCRFSFVVEPRTDFENLYDERYYAGRGADPHVAYAAGTHGGPSVQRYEWQGIISILRDNAGLTTKDRWLDYGCGLGGLVDFGRRAGYQVWGHDAGYAAEELRHLGVPSLSPDELASTGPFDVITCIEVLEHLIEPLAVLRELARLLRPGGLLFVTTGNAQPYRGRIDRWQYVRPDIHVSFFEPQTLRIAYEKAGLEALALPFGPGYADIVRSKVLRTLDRHEPSAIERALPWGLVSRLVDRRFGVSAQPAARKAVPVNGTTTGT
jgi:SAM-dependent methyltransferase